jgi:hypothetical protein
MGMEPIAELDDVLQLSSTMLQALQMLIVSAQ